MWCLITCEVLNGTFSFCSCRLGVATWDHEGILSFLMYIRMQFFTHIYMNNTNIYIEMSLKSLSKGMMHPIVSESHKLMTLRGLRQSRRRRCIWSQILLGSWFVVDSTMGFMAISYFLTNLKLRPKQTCIMTSKTNFQCLIDMVRVREYKYGLPNSANHTSSTVIRHDWINQICPGDEGTRERHTFLLQNHHCH